MTFLAAIALVLLAFCGHTALWTTFVNRIHATTISKVWVMAANIIGLGSLVALPIVFATWFWKAASVVPAASGFWSTLGRLYLIGTAILGVYATLRWSRRRLNQREPAEILRSKSAERINLRQQLGNRVLGGGIRRLIASLPLNESLHLEVTRKELLIPRMPPALDGLSLAHLSDLHFAGGIEKHYFQEVTRIANDFEPDLIVVTGDLVDRHWCIDWIPELLGRLRARFGVYAILGNHDVRLKQHVGRLRQALAECGIHYLGGRHAAVDLGPSRVILAGNELPWLGPAPDMRQCPSRAEEPEALRLLLSHSPDQYAWARQHDFDLMLAGHNHGGQINFPLIGPLFSPSRHGVRYACGVFHEPPTVLHVSRGISALDPIRYNCPPELACLVLRSGVALQPNSCRNQAAPALASRVE